MADIFVSKSGSNTSPYDTLAKAATTFGPAYTQATGSADTIWFDAGTWTGAEMEAGGVSGYIRIQKSLVLKAITPGTVFINPSVATACIYNNAAANIDLFVGAGITLCDGVNGTTPSYAIRWNAAAGTSNIDFNGTIGAASLYGIWIDPASVSVINLSGDDMVITATRSGIHASGLPAASTVSLVHPKVTCPSKLVGGLPNIYIKAAAAGVTCELFEPEIITVHNVAMPAQEDRGISVININNALVYKPSVTITTLSATGSAVGVAIDCDSGTLTANYGRILGGTISIDANGGIIAIYGHDATGNAGDNRCNFGLIRGVTGIGGAKFSAGLGHGIMIGNCQDSSAYLNTMTEAGIGVLLKGTTRGLFNANKVSKCSSTYMQMKGCADSSMNGNEVFLSNESDAVYDGEGINANPNSAVNNSNCKFSGNVFVVPSTGTLSRIIAIGVGQDADGSQNIFYIKAGASLPNPVATYGANNYSNMQTYINANEISSSVSTDNYTSRIGGGSSQSSGILSSPIGSIIS